MKRYEMIAKIVDEIEAMRGVEMTSDGPFYVYPDDVTIAKRILDVVEKRGMMPPDTSVSVVFNFLHNTLESHTFNKKWEPDEE